MAKAGFILATDGAVFEAEHLDTGDAQSGDAHLGETASM